MGYDERRFSLALTFSFLLHVSIFTAIYIANLNAKVPATIKADTPIIVSLSNVKYENPTQKQEQKEAKKNYAEKQELAKNISQIPISKQPQNIHTPITETKQSVVHEAKQLPMQDFGQKQNNDEIKKYLAKIKKKLQENLEYPSFAKKAGMEGVTTVCFCLKNDGRLVEGSLKIVNSSGYSVLDRQALATVEDSIPFALPPKQDMEITIGIEFVLAS